MALIGFDEMLEMLKALSDEGRLSHGILFTGMEGIGKKKLAWELSSHLLTIRSAALEHHPDFLFLHEKTTLGVEEIKKAIRFVIEKPLFGKRKVLLIDDAHKMNLPAQNKFLKTLEEPPEFLTILMVSSAPGRLLDTIRSRVVEFTLKAHGEETIYQALKDYPEKERRLAARFSGGSFLRAFGILEDEEMRKLFFFPEKIFDALSQGDRLKLLEYAKEYGKDRELAGMLLDHLLLWLRDMALVSHKRTTTNLYYQDRGDVLVRHSQILGRGRISWAQDELEKAQKRLAANCNPEILIWTCLLQLQEGINL